MSNMATKQNPFVDPVDEDEISPVSTEVKAPSVATNHQEILQQMYDTELLEVPEQARQVLEQYSKVPSDEVFPHILQVREDAWRTAQYACIAQYRFLDFALPRSSAYPAILERLKTGQHQFLDVGCCLGSELRQLVLDGVNAEHLYGIDIHPQFFEIGYSLFRDADKLNALFLAANILDVSEGSVLHQLRGKIDIIWTSAVLHLFDWKRQVAAIVSMLKLLKRAPNTMIAGRIMGSQKPGEYPGPRGGEKVYSHDVLSFKKMFHEACDIVGEKWETEVTAKPWTENLKISWTQESVPDGLIEVEFVAKKLERLDTATSHRFVF
jgi:2-polyprenyl-3-methyl-5-hydroxy-6-metoxy-1,4-benzoquinol methylase